MTTAARKGGVAVPYRRASILVIDDDLGIRDMAAEALRDEGYRAVTLVNHAEAVQYLRALRFGLILADSAGSGVADPWAALEAVKAAAGDTPVIIFSAHPPRVFAGYRERGFAGLIAKPFDLDDLLGTVKTVLTGQ
jgi:DNA-binding NtrC family response regulator